MAELIEVDKQLRKKGVEIEVTAHIRETLPDGRSVTGTTQRLTIPELIEAMERLNR